MKLHPFNECVRDAEKLMQAGHKIFQQFNCSRCGAKQTMETPDVFYRTGQCEECGHITDIEKDGCNYMVYAIF